MITFFKKDTKRIIAVQSDQPITEENIEKLTWLFSGAKALKAKSVKGSGVCHFLAKKIA